MAKIVRRSNEGGRIQRRVRVLFGLSLSCGVALSLGAVGLIGTSSASATPAKTNLITNGSFEMCIRDRSRRTRRRTSQSSFTTRPTPTSRERSVRRSLSRTSASPTPHPVAGGRRPRRVGISRVNLTAVDTTLKVAHTGDSIVASYCFVVTTVAEFAPTVVTVLTVPWVSSLFER